MLSEFGDTYLTLGDLEQALKAQRDGLAIAERLAATDRSNTVWHRDLSVLYGKVGGVLQAESKLDEALKAYRDSLAIAEHLAAADRSNTGWQMDLLVSYDRMGNVLQAHGKLDQALEAYRNSLAIAERLATADRSNMGWQRDLSVSYNKVGDVLVAQGKLDEALKAYRDSLAIRERLAAADRSNAQWQNDLQFVIGRIGTLSYRFALAGDFAKAIAVADEVIALAPEKPWLYTNRAHALMFVGRIEEARALYLKYRGTKDVQGGKSWEAVILEDFVELRKARLVHTLMDEIEKLFTARG